MIGAAKLNVHTYEEVEADAGALGQAIGVVVLSSVATGIGLAGRSGAPGLIVGVLAALIAWFIWAFVTYLIGTKLLPMPQTHANLGQLLRTTGFSAAPGILRVLAIVPMLGWLVLFVTWIWMLAAFVIAVRQALDYTSTGRALGVCLLGAVANIVILSVLRGFLPG